MLGQLIFNWTRVSQNSFHCTESGLGFSKLKKWEGGVGGGEALQVSTQKVIIMTSAIADHTLTVGVYLLGLQLP